MTNAPVLSITDELIAELVRECRTGADDHAGMNHEEESALFDRIGDVLLALLAERAELKRDAERYRWLVDQGDSMQWQNIMRIEVDDYATIGDAINEVMRQEGRL